MQQKKRSGFWPFQYDNSMNKDRRELFHWIDGTLVPLRETGGDGGMLSVTYYVDELFYRQRSDRDLP